MNEKKSLREKRSRYIKKKVKQSVAIINSTSQFHVQTLTDEDKIDENNCYNYSNNIRVDHNSDTENISSSYLAINNVPLNEQSTHSSSSIIKDASLCSDYNENCEQLSSKIAKWAVKNNITSSALKELLAILREDSSYCANNLPIDSRTLLKTPNKLYGEKLGSGLFHYFGIAETLNSLCISLNINITSDTEFFLAVNIDGLPLSKSSASSFWPILCSVKSIEALKNKVFLVALYHGNEKPSLNHFLLDFVSECAQLTTEGILIKNVICKFKIEMLICDIPAKSFALSVKSHSGYFSCTKCNQEGEMINNVICFVETENLIKRTNDSFRNKLHPEHHVGETPFINIPGFNIIDNVPFDYMHNLLLGGTKRLLCSKRYGLIFGKPPYKLRAKNVNDINTLLFKIRKYIPCEFSRKTRSIVECKRYKATEFRLFLLYTGPIVLRQVLSPKVYNNFITLSLASTILISNYYSKYEHYISYADELMKHFITNSIQIYGPDFISLNIHSFLHLGDCVRLFGSLDNFSAFPFENFMQQLKKMVRKPSQPLQQVIRRIVEENHTLKPIKNTNNNLPELLMEHSDGPLISTCHPPQYKKFKTTEYCLNINKIADRFVELQNKTIIEIKNFVFHDKSAVIVGYRYSLQNDFYNKPCKSSIFDIQYIKKTNNLLEMWPLDDISRKVMILPFRGQYVSFPLLHL